MKELVRELGDGKTVARGGFRIDDSRAHEKMERYQLPDPLLYVLEFVQAAHLLGAGQIDFDIDADELEMNFDGGGLSVDELEDIYSYAFSRAPGNRAQARRHMAIGLTALGALKPAEVRVTMVRPHGEKAEFLMKDHAESVRKIDAPENDDATESRNRIYVRDKFEFGHLVEFFLKFAGNLGETRLVEERCKFARIPIRVNGRLVSRGHTLSRRARHETRVTWKGERGLVALRPDQLQEERVSRVQLVQNGVWTWSAPFEHHLVGMEAMFETNRLTRDLSRAAFVQDSDYQRLMDEVIPRAYYKAMLAWVRSLTVTFHNCDGLRRIATETWRRVLEPDDVLVELRVLAVAMTRLPIWLDASRDDAAELVSVQDLIGDSTDPDTTILYSLQRKRRSFDRPVFWRRPDVLDAFHVIGRYIERDWELVDPELLDPDSKDNGQDSADSVPPTSVNARNSSDIEKQTRSDAVREPTDSPRNKEPDDASESVPPTSVSARKVSAFELSNESDTDARSSVVNQLNERFEAVLNSTGNDFHVNRTTPNPDHIAQPGRLENGNAVVDWDHPVAQYAREDPGDPIRAVFLLSGFVTAVRYHCEEMDVANERAVQNKIFSHASSNE